MNATNNAKLAEKKAAGVNIHLYSDDHPETTVRGTGFKDAATARRTLELIKRKPRNRQVWTVNAMYHRAKHHPHQTPSMREAMALYRSWLDEYAAEKRKRVDDGGDVPVEGKRIRPRPNGECDGGDIPQLRSPSPRCRSEAEREYKQLFNVTLPEVARRQGWPVHLNHCLMRVALDTYWQCCWYEKLDQKKGALKSMTLPQIENVVFVGEKMAAEGKAYVERLNKESLAYRGKKGPGGKSSSGDDENISKAKKRSPLSSSGTHPSAQKSPTKIEKATSVVSGHGSKSQIGDAPLQVERAATGRSSCRLCKVKISKNEHRVGMRAWSSGREITVWHHPRCFLGGGGCDGAAHVERLGRGSPARCRLTGEGFVKGDLRLVLQTGATKHFYRARECIHPVLAPVYAVVEGLPISMGALSGLDKLSEEERKDILEAMSS